MVRLLLKRGSAFIFSLTVIIIIGFWLMEIIPGDPVQRLLLSSNQFQTAKVELRSQQYDDLYYRSGYQLPSFYFTWTNLSVPDSFYRIPQAERRNQLIALSSVTGKPEEVYNFRKAEEQLLVFSGEISSADKIKSQIIISRLKQQITISGIENILSGVKQNSFDSLTLKQYRNLINDLNYFKNYKSEWINLIPVITFHKNNRFHQWLTGKNDVPSISQNKGIINADLGYSTVSNRKVTIILKRAFTITLIISVAAILISLLLAIPVAITIVYFRNKKIVKLIPGLLLFIYTIPLFFLSTLLLLLFANPEMLNILPSSGIGPVAGFNKEYTSVQKIFHSIPYFILPLIAYISGSLAFFIRITEASVEDQLNLDYIRTARAKGAGEKRVISIHALRNSIIPLLTNATTAFPAMIIGSVILENIFSIPGMGTEMVRAVQNSDYPVLIGFFLITGFVTVTVFLLSDLLHYYIDPRKNLFAGYTK